MARTRSGLAFCHHLWELDLLSYFVWLCVLLLRGSRRFVRPAGFKVESQALLGIAPGKTKGR